jgi:hypothetical protein
MLTPRRAEGRAGHAPSTRRAERPARRRSGFGGWRWCTRLVTPHCCHRPAWVVILPSASRPFFAHSAASSASSSSCHYHPSAAASLLLRAAAHRRGRLGGSSRVTSVAARDGQRLAKAVWLRRIVLSAARGAWRRSVQPRGCRGRGAVGQRGADVRRRHCGRVRANLAHVLLPCATLTRAPRSAPLHPATTAALFSSTTCGASPSLPTAALPAGAGWKRTARRRAHAPGARACWVCGCVHARARART